MNTWIVFLRNNARFLSFGFTINICLAVGQTYFVSLFNTAIQASLSLSHGEVATLYGVATVLGSLGIAPVGRLLDAIDLRLFVALVLVFVALSCGVMAFATSVPILFVGMIGVRFFAGVVLGVTGQATIARYFEATRGRASSVANMGYAVSYAIFPFFVTAMIQSVGWRATWGMFGVAFIVIALPLTFYELRGQGERHRLYLDRIDEAATAAMPDTGRHFTLREVLRDPRFYMIVPGLVTVPCILFTFQYHQLALVEEKGWNLQTFALAYLAFSAVAFIANLAAGAMVDRWGSRVLMTICLWPMMPALALVAWAKGEWAIPLYMIFTALTFGFNLVTAITVWSELYGTRHIGAIRGLSAALNTLVASSGMALGGWLIDRGVTLATQAIYNMMVVVVAAALLYTVASRMPRRAKYLS